MVAVVLIKLSLLYPRFADGGGEGTSRAAGSALAIVESRRWKYGEVAWTELAECMLMALLTIASSNNGADSKVVVGLDLHMVTFLARSF